MNIFEVNKEIDSIKKDFNKSRIKAGKRFHKQAATFMPGVTNNTYLMLIDTHINAITDNFDVRVDIHKKNGSIETIPTCLRREDEDIFVSIAGPGRAMNRIPLAFNSFEEVKELDSVVIYIKINGSIGESIEWGKEICPLPFQNTFIYKRKIILKDEKEYADDHIIPIMCKIDDYFFFDVLDEIEDMEKSRNPIFFCGMCEKGKYGKCENIKQCMDENDSIIWDLVDVDSFTVIEQTGYIPYAKGTRSSGQIVLRENGRMSLINVFMDRNHPIQSDIAEYKRLAKLAPEMTKFDEAKAEETIDDIQTVNAIKSLRNKNVRIKMNSNYIEISKPIKSTKEFFEEALPTAEELMEMAEDFEDQMAEMFDDDEEDIPGSNVISGNFNPFAH